MAARFMMASRRCSPRRYRQLTGYDVKRTLKVLDTRAAEYAGDPAAADDSS
jgi:hypothetical protein